MQVTYRPNANGSYVPAHYTSDQGAPYQCVDDVTPDDDISYIYVQQSDGNIYATFKFPNPTETGIINSITVYVRGRQVWGSVHDGNWYVALYQPGYSPASYGAGSISTSYVYQSQVFTTNPFTSAAWSWSDLNSLQIGCYMGMYGSGSYIRITKIYVVIDYTPISTGGAQIIGLTTL